MAPRSHRVAGLALAVAALACSGHEESAAPARRLALLDLGKASRPAAESLRITVDGVASELPVGRAVRARIGNSERDVVVTRPGSEWLIDVEVHRGDRLALDVRAVGSAADPVVTVLRRGEPIATLRPARALATAWTAWRWDASADADRVVLGGGGALVWSNGELRGGPPDPRPNVVLLSLDTLRADHLSLQGYRRATSPNLEAFAQRAMVFENSLAAASWTLPSHASMLTGLLPMQHRLLALADHLGETTTTVAERLRAAGYRTVALTDGGFMDPAWGLSKGFEQYDVTSGAAWEPKDVRVIVDQASTWLRRREAGPFFLFLHTYETHQPYTDAEGFAAPFLDPSYRGPFVAHATSHYLNAGHVSPQDRERMVALYDGEIRRLDAYLGRFFALLEEEGLLERTAVIVTSDHGEEFEEHGDFEHALGKVFDENLKVPLVVRLPGGSQAGRYRVATSGVDLAPTILHLAGIAPEPALPGEDLATLARSPAGRVLVAEGTSSHPDLHEVRYRLDHEEVSYVRDAVRGLQAAFRRTSTGWQPAAMAGPVEALGDRLQFLLAWSRGASWVTRFTPAGEGWRLAATRGVELEGWWQQFSRHSPGQDEAALTSSQPVALELRLSAAPQALVLRRADGGELRLALRFDRQRVRPGWNPLRDELPPDLDLVKAAGGRVAGKATIGSELERELKALGYL